MISTKKRRNGKKRTLRIRSKIWLGGTGNKIPYIVQLLSFKRIDQITQENQNKNLTKIYGEKYTPPAPEKKKSNNDRFLHQYKVFVMFLNQDVADKRVGDINYQDPESGMTALYFIYQKIIYYQPDDENPSNIYNTLLEIFKTLLENGADPTIIIDGSSIIKLHMKDQNPDIELLLNSYYPLYKLAEKYLLDNNIQELLSILKVEFNHGRTVNRDKLSAIDPIDGLNIFGKICKRMEETIPQPRTQIETLLTMPLFNVFKLLLEHGANPTDESKKMYPLLETPPFNLFCYFINFKNYILLNMQRLLGESDNSEKNSLCNSVLKHFPNFRKFRSSSLETITEIQITKEEEKQKILTNKIGALPRNMKKSFLHGFQKNAFSPNDEILPYLNGYNESVLKELNIKEQTAGKRSRSEIYTDVNESERGNIPQEIYLQRYCTLFLIIGFLTRLYEPICQIIMKGGKALQLNLAAFSSNDFDILIIPPFSTTVRQCQKTAIFKGVDSATIIETIRKLILRRSGDIDLSSLSYRDIVQDIADLIIYFTTPFHEKPIFFQKSNDVVNIIKISFKIERFDRMESAIDLSYGYEKIPEILKNKLYYPKSFIKKDFHFFTSFQITTCFNICYMSLWQLIFDKLYYFYFYQLGLLTYENLISELFQGSDKFLLDTYKILSESIKSKEHLSKLDIFTTTFEEFSDHRSKILTRLETMYKITSSSSFSEIEKYKSLGEDFYYDLKDYIDFLKYKRSLHYYFEKLKRQLKEIATEIAPRNERIFLIKLLIWYNDVFHDTNITKEYFEVLLRENFQLIDMLHRLGYNFEQKQYQQHQQYQLLKDDNEYLKNVFEYINLREVYSKNTNVGNAGKEFVPPYRYNPIYNISFLQAQIEIMKKWIKSNEILIPDFYIHQLNRDKIIIAEFDKIFKYADEILATTGN